MGTVEIGLRKTHWHFKIILSAGYECRVTLQENLQVIRGAVLK